MTADRPVIAATGLSKRYGHTPALSNLSLQVPAGEYLTVLGPSGAGKTTLLRILAGFVPPDSGAVLVHGRDITRLAPHRRNIGVVFQSYALFPHLTAADNVAFPLAARRVGRDQRRRRALAALHQVDLADLADRYPHQLSGGQQQRVALARAFVFGPSILLMDEPLGALDRVLREQLRTEIRLLVRQLELTVIHVTHDQEEALALGDRAAVLERGRIAQIDTGEELYERPATAFVARFLGEANLLPATVLGGGRSVALGGDATVPVDPAAVRRVGVADGSRLLLAVRPERIRLERIELGPPGDAPAGLVARVPGVVREVSYLGATRRLQVDLACGQSIVVRQDGTASALPAGVPVVASWPAAAGVPLPDPSDAPVSGTSAPAGMVPAWRTASGRVTAPETNGSSQGWSTRG
jgi:putative spermidine/putrescine transport system ATP-binding protein